MGVTVLHIIGIFGLPRIKESKLDAASSTIKMKRENPSTHTTQAKRKCSRSNPMQTQVHKNPFKFHPVNEQWQQNVCAQMGLQFHTKTRVRAGSPNIPLTRPDMRSVKRIEGSEHFHISLLGLRVNTWLSTSYS